MGKEETMSVCSEAASSREAEEKILVTVRVRPVNQRELGRNDVASWECINNTTILFKDTFPDRSLCPTAYTFDRVFGSKCPTEQVYEEAAREIALSVVSGINSSIFAYGQTSSGKTYTMNGVTECAMADIFDYIDKHQEREFVLKFSAMEIYNEQVRDLLSSDTTPLRLLDDPEKGTVVERLTEETLEDWNHLEELLSVCKAQRQVGETCLNETSSRSHQILRLTVESSYRNYLAAGNSSILTASVNFIDLAGSERASQALTAGVRLKEGSHINRSLLTLGTVIRKLSKGRSGHIPYRDSKLTRILQNSLGGNARTAIICTMSPAHSHVEQSRNTLLFASCAKEVSTNARVNLVMSDKALVKQLQKELARLESQISSIGSISDGDSTAAALREKDLLISELNEEIKELTRQRDLDETHIKSLLKSAGDDQNSSLGTSEVISRRLRRNKIKYFDDSNVDSPGKKILQITESNEDYFLLDNSTPKFTGLDPCEGWEDIAQRNDLASEDTCKELQRIETRASCFNNNLGAEVPLTAARKEKENPTLLRATDANIVASTQKEDYDSCPLQSVDTYNALKQKIQELHETINRLEKSASKAEESSSKGFRWSRSKSRRSVVMSIPSDLWSVDEDISETFETQEYEKPEYIEKKLHDQNTGMGNISRTDSRDSYHSASTEESMDTRVIGVDVNDTASVLDFVSGLNKIAKLQSEKDNGHALVPEAYSKADETKGLSNFGMVNWPLKFERYQRKIIELWAKCNVPLVHRSYFFLLFKGDPSDRVYMEVELRRLQFLHNTFSHGTKTDKGVDSRIISPASSLRALNREREMMTKRIQKKLTRKEREMLYGRWGIKLESKRRSLQLASLLWTDTHNIKHVLESAVLVAKLIGFVEPRHVPKEMLRLSLSTPSTCRRSSRWVDNMSSLP